MTFLDGILADLRERGLAPVAIALAVAVLAVPVLLHKSADGVEVADPSTATAPGAEPDRPLVALAALRTASDLDTFDTKNPFRSLRPVAELTSTDVVAVQPSSGGSSPSGGDTGGGSSSFSGGSSFPSSGGAPSSPPSDPVTPPPTTPGTAPTNPAPPSGGGDKPSGGPGKGQEPAPTDPGEEETVTKALFTHQISMAFARNDRERTIRGIRRLDLLPNSNNPLLAFLGVDPPAETAMFLVDGAVTQSGEGVCRPSPEECRFLSLKVDDDQDEHTFTDEANNEYYFRLRDIERVLIDPVVAAASLDSFPQLVDVEEVSVTSTSAPASSRSSR